MTTDISSWDILEYLKSEKRWFTSKEVMVHFKKDFSMTERVKFNRKFRSLLKAGRIISRKCKRDIAWYNEDEYKYGRTKK